MERTDRERVRDADGSVVRDADRSVVRDADGSAVRDADGPTVRDADHFDERADRFREIGRELADRACLSPVGDAATVEGAVRETLSTPAAYGSIDDLAVVPPTELPAWYREQLARGETCTQRMAPSGSRDPVDGDSRPADADSRSVGTDSRSAANAVLEATPPSEGVEDPLELVAAEEYLRLDVTVDGDRWDTYLPIPRTSAEYDGSAFATLREALDGRPIERFHCARMPIRYERGRYVPDLEGETYDRWLRERGFVRWTAEAGYELKPPLRLPAVTAAGAGMAASGLVVVAAAAALFLVVFPLVPELFLVGLWYLLPITFIYSLSLADRVFRAVFARVGRRRLRRV